MRALTLRQPHAAALIVGVKRYETRTWPAHSAIGQRVALHAGLSDDPDGPGTIGTDALGTPFWWLPEPWAEADQVARGLPADGDLVGVPFTRGAIIGSGILNRCIPIIDIADGTTPGDALVVAPGTPPLLWLNRQPVWPAALYGRFVPGTWAWEFIDIAPTSARCPWCWCNQLVNLRSGGAMSVDAMQSGADSEGDPCPVCMPDRSDGWKPCVGKCDPIPAKGKQGLWEWTP